VEQVVIAVQARRTLQEDGHAGRARHSGNGDRDRLRTPTTSKNRTAVGEQVAVGVCAVVRVWGDDPQLCAHVQADADRQASPLDLCRVRELGVTARSDLTAAARTRTLLNTALASRSSGDERCHSQQCQQPCTLLVPHVLP